MTSFVKNCLMLTLIFSLAILPLRMASAMPTDFSNDHCSDMNMSTDNTDHHMQMNMDLTEYDQSSYSSGDNCCDQCNDDCSHCINSISAIETELPIIINQLTIVKQISLLPPFHTRTLTIPYRPPQTLHI